MVAGAFSLRPPFLGLGSFFSCGTGPSPAACFLPSGAWSSPFFFLSSAIAISFTGASRFETTSRVDLDAAALGDAHALAVLQHLGADAGRLLRLRIHQRQVGDVDAAVPLDDAARGRRGVLAALQMALEDHQLLHDGAASLVVDLEDLAGLALLLAGEDVDEIALLDAN